MSLVSIILPCYNRGNYVSIALESIAKQTHEEWEILLVDDCGPDDGTREALESFAERHPNHRIEYFRHEVNQTVSGARNTGIKHARGSYLTCLDPDDLWAPGFLAAHLATFNKFPDAGVSYTSPELIDSHGNSMGLWEMPSDYLERFPESLFSMAYWFIIPSSALLRRENVGDEFYFDTSFGGAQEDLELWVRFVLRGINFAFTPNAGAYYRRHDGSASNDLKKFRLGTIRLMNKYASEPRFISAVAGVFFDHCRELEANMRELAVSRDLTANYNQSLIFRLRCLLKGCLRK